MTGDMKRILFWQEETATPLLLGAIGELFNIAPLPRPRDYVRRDVPYEDRMVVVRALQLRSTMNKIGCEVLMGYLGWADCRICGEQLGTRDFFGHGFIWPEKAEHYVESHGVWHPDHTLLLHAVRTAPRGSR